MSALFIRRCWCFGPRPAGQSIFATTAFSQLMMLLSEREDLQRRWTFWPNQFFHFIYFLFQSRSFFFSCSVRNMYYNRKNILFYNKKKNHINSLQHEEKERNEHTSDDRNFFSFVIHEQCARLISHHLSSFCIVILKYTYISRVRVAKLSRTFFMYCDEMVLAGHSLKTRSIKVLRVHKMTMWNVGRPFDIFRHQRL